jgi:hypothetical protein
MARGQRDIWPVLCFYECRLSLSQDNDEYTSFLLDKLRDWPWIGKVHVVKGRGLRVFSHPPEDGGYVLVFDITSAGVVRPVLVFEGIDDEQEFLRGLDGLIELLTNHATMVAIESGH